MHLFPAIDLIQGQVVRLLRGEYDQKTIYGQDPLAMAREFERAGASWLHVVDLDGAKSGKPEHLQVIRSICAGTRLKVEVGGGIRDRTTIDQLLDAGVNRVILGTAALKQWDWFESQAADPKLERRLVLGLDARLGKLAIDGWQNQLEVSALQIAAKVSDWPLAAIVFTDIATDGTLQGPNVASTLEMAQATRVPVVASGGVGNANHLFALRKLPLQGAIVGRALYDGTLSIQQALTALEGDDD